MVVFGLPASSTAQLTFEATGSRALGMGGAFVAVADDPSAVFWNPAGLASGQPAGMTIEWVRFQNGDRDSAPGAGPWKRSAKFVSLGTWPIGISYSKFDDTTLLDRGAGLETRRFSTKHYGATVLQSLTEGLVVGATLKYVRGTVASGPAVEATVGDALDAGSERDGVTSGVFDWDASVMYDAQVFRIGWTLRNLRSPRFKGGDDEGVELQRLSRLGLAVLPVAGLILAADLDLATTDLSEGPRRMLAFGAEQRVSSRVVVRGGARWNLEGAKTTVGSFGASFALQAGTWLDGHVTHGRARGERGFGFALRAGW
jgi:hypothetical protein